jgi:hypothetical protein
MESRILNSKIAAMFKQKGNKKFIELYHTEDALTFVCLMTLMFKTLGTPSE